MTSFPFLNIPEKTRRTMQAKPNQPPVSGTRKWLAVGLALVIAWAIFASSTRRLFKLDELAPPTLETSGAPRPADFGWTLLDLDDKPVDFAAFRGKTILLNLWATWCGPCLKEMPSIAKLAASEDFKGRDIAFICVSTDESTATVRKFMEGKDWKMTIFRATSIPLAYQSEGIPATFLIGPDGRIAAAELGSAQWDDPSVVYFLQKLAGSGGK
jgi:thiol-disulfide isomerase/thioredoxin